MFFSIAFSPLWGGQPKPKEWLNSLGISGEVGNAAIASCGTALPVTIHSTRAEIRPNHYLIAAANRGLVRTWLQEMKERGCMTFDGRIARSAHVVVDRRITCSIRPDRAIDLRPFPGRSPTRQMRLSTGKCSRRLDPEIAADTKRWTQNNLMFGIPSVDVQLLDPWNEGARLARLAGGASFDNPWEWAPFATSPDLRTRRALASNRWAEPATLRALIRDPDSDVRSLLAMNPSLPERDRLALTHDGQSLVARRAHYKIGHSADWLKDDPSLFEPPISIRIERRAEKATRKRVKRELAREKRERTKRAKAQAKPSQPNPRTESSTSGLHKVPFSKVELRLCGESLAVVAWSLRPGDSLGSRPGLSLGSRSPEELARWHERTRAKECWDRWRPAATSELLLEARGLGVCVSRDSYVELDTETGVLTGLSFWPYCHPSRRRARTIPLAVAEAALDGSDPVAKQQLLYNLYTSESALARLTDEPSLWLDFTEWPRIPDSIIESLATASDWRLRVRLAHLAELSGPAKQILAEDRSNSARIALACNHPGRLSTEIIERLAASDSTRECADERRRRDGRPPIGSTLEVQPEVGHWPELSDPQPSLDDRD